MNIVKEEPKIGKKFKWNTRRSREEERAHLTYGLSAGLHGEHPAHL